MADPKSNSVPFGKQKATRKTLRIGRASKASPRSSRDRRREPNSRLTPRFRRTLIDAVSASQMVSTPFSSLTDRRIRPCGLRHDTDLTTPVISMVFLESEDNRPDCDARVPDPNTARPHDVRLTTRKNRRYVLISCRACQLAAALCLLQTLPNSIPARAARFGTQFCTAHVNSVRRRTIEHTPRAAVRPPACGSVSSCTPSCGRPDRRPDRRPRNRRRRHDSTRVVSSCGEPKLTSPWPVSWRGAFLLRRRHARSSESK